MEFINRTPWDTEALKAFILPLLETSPAVKQVEVVNHRPQPGRKKSEQHLARVRAEFPWKNGRQGHGDPISVKVELLSPKRAKKRTKTLDRLSQIEDLEAHEVFLPDEAIGEVVHSLAYLGRSDINYYEKISHVEGRCCTYRQCDDRIKALAARYNQRITGDANATIGEQVSLEDLKQRYEAAVKSVEYCEKRLKLAIKRRNSLHKRIEKAQSKKVR